MQPQPTAEDKKGFLKNDRLLVCSMFVFYGVCILGLLATTFWGLDRRSQRISANATSTAFAVATQQAHVTATVMTRLAEQNQYEFIERFDEPSKHWLSGEEDDEYWTGVISIEDGLYIWDGQKVKQDFIYWANFYKGNYLADFDVYVDSKFVDAVPGGVCTGFVFRKTPGDWEDGAYTFSVCNDSHFEIDYYRQDEWDAISGWQYEEAIEPADWNRIEINARGNHFTFIINNVVVFEMTDDRQKQGGLAILFEANEEQKGQPVSVWFDNFGYQGR